METFNITILTFILNKSFDDKLSRDFFGLILIRLVIVSISCCRTKILVLHLKVYFALFQWCTWMTEVQIDTKLIYNTLENANSAPLFLSN